MLTMMNDNDVALSSEQLFVFDGIIVLIIHIWPISQDPLFGTVLVGWVIWPVNGFPNLTSHVSSEMFKPLFTHSVQTGTCKRCIVSVGFKLGMCIEQFAANLEHKGKDSLWVKVRMEVMP